MIDPQGIPPAAPHSIEAEQAVLGALLLSDATHQALLVDQGLRPEDFYRDRHRVVFSAILDLHGQGDPVDVLTVTEHLRSCGRLEEAGGAAQVDALAGAVPNVAHLRQYGKIVRDLADRRRFLSLTFEAQAALYGSTATDEVIAAHEASFTAFLRSAPNRGLIVRSRDEFVALQRPKTTPLVATDKTRALMPGGNLIVASPTGLGKSLALLDLAGQLGSDGGDWFGFNVVGGQRVLLLSLEGDDETTRERLEQLIPPGASVELLDYWQRDGRPGDRPSVASAAAVGALIRERHYSVVVIDTLTAYLGDVYDIAFGVPEAAWVEIERLRRYAGHDFALLSAVHTRKPQTTNSATAAEEIAGGIAKKVDTAIVLRADGDSQRRRRVSFAKTRSGPALADVIAELPEDEDEAPRFSIVADIGTPRFKPGTEAEQIAEWIAKHDEPIGATLIQAGTNVSASTLRDRRSALQTAGVLYGRLPGRGNRHGYGTAEQWQQLTDKTLGIAAKPTNPQTHGAAGLTDRGFQSPETSGFEPTNPQTHGESACGFETPINAGLLETHIPTPPKGGPVSSPVAPDDLDWSEAS